MIIFYYREKLKENVSFAKFYSLAKGVHFFRAKISQWIFRSALFFPVHKWNIPCVWCVVCGCANIKGSIAASSSVGSDVLITNKYGYPTTHFSPDQSQTHPPSQAIFWVFWLRHLKDASWNRPAETFSGLLYICNQFLSILFSCVCEGEAAWDIFLFLTRG